MHLANVRMRFGLILEAFCRGLGPTQLSCVVKQVEAIEKLTKLTDHLKEEKDAVRTVKTLVLQFMYKTLCRQYSHFRTASLKYCLLM